MQEALTSRPPHVILLPHPSFDFEKLSSLIERLEVGLKWAMHVWPREAYCIGNAVIHSMGQHGTA